MMIQVICYNIIVSIVNFSVLDLPCCDQRANKDYEAIFLRKNIGVLNLQNYEIAMFCNFRHLLLANQSTRVSYD